MKKSQKNNTQILIGVCVFVCFISFTTTQIMQEHTLTSAYIAWLYGAAFAAVLYWPMRKIWKRMGRLWVRIVVHTLTLTCLCTAVILTINYSFRDLDHASIVPATVINKYSEERTVHRRHRAPHRYKVYYMNICIPDDINIKVQISADAYTHTRCGSSIPVALCDGFFGLPVVDWS